MTEPETEGRESGKRISPQKEREKKGKKTDAVGGWSVKETPQKSQNPLFACQILKLGREEEKKRKLQPFLCGLSRQLVSDSRLNSSTFSQGTFAPKRTVIFQFHLQDELCPRTKYVYCILLFSLASFFRYLRKKSRREKKKDHVCQLERGGLNEGNTQTSNWTLQIAGFEEFQEDQIAKIHAGIPVVFLTENFVFSLLLP